MTESDPSKVCRDVKFRRTWMTSPHKGSARDGDIHKEIQNRAPPGKHCRLGVALNRPRAMESFRGARSATVCKQTQTTSDSSTHRVILVLSRCTWLAQAEQGRHASNPFRQWFSSIYPCQRPGL